jgi:hypothetical protein
MAGWILNTNCHVTIWTGVPKNVFPPAALPLYDGVGQMLTPNRLRSLAGVAPGGWIGRVIIPPNIVLQSTDVLPAGANTSYLRFKDDLSGLSYGYYQVVDISPSTQVNPLIPGVYEITALFVAYTVAPN